MFFVYDNNKEIEEYVMTEDEAFDIIRKFISDSTIVSTEDLKSYGFHTLCLEDKLTRVDYGAYKHHFYIKDVGTNMQIIKHEEDKEGITTLFYSKDYDAYYVAITNYEDNDSCVYFCKEDGVPITYNGPWVLSPHNHDKTVEAVLNHPNLWTTLKHWKEVTNGKT